MIGGGGVCDINAGGGGGVCDRTEGVGAFAGGGFGAAAAMSAACIGWNGVVGVGGRWNDARAGAGCAGTPSGDVDVATDGWSLSGCFPFLGCDTASP